MKTCKDITLRKLDIKGLYFRDGDLLMKVDGVEINVDLMNVLSELFEEDEFSLTGLRNTETPVSQLDDLLNQTV
jgi:hypothetical protein